MCFSYIQRAVIICLLWHSISSGASKAVDMNMGQYTELKLMRLVLVLFLSSYLMCVSFFS